MSRGRKKSNHSKNEIIHVRIDEKLSKALESFCKASDMSKSDAVRMIMESMLI